MPHIHLEVTTDLLQEADVPRVLEDLVSRLESYETIAAPSVKAYFTQRDVWSMGTGAAAGFIHCTVSILKGRSLDLRRHISSGMSDTLRDFYRNALDEGRAGLTLELREMDVETYVK